jgi:hypothetical protein
VQRRQRAIERHARDGTPTATICLLQQHSRVPPATRQSDAVDQ